MAMGSWTWSRAWGRGDGTRWVWGGAGAGSWHGRHNLHHGSRLDRNWVASANKQPAGGARRSSGIGPGGTHALCTNCPGKSQLRAVQFACAPAHYEYMPAGKERRTAGPLKGDKLGLMHDIGLLPPRRSVWPSTDGAFGTEHWNGMDGRSRKGAAPGPSSLQVRVPGLATPSRVQVKSSRVARKGPETREQSSKVQRGHGGLHRRGEGIDCPLPTTRKKPKNTSLS
ncbi:hypothetical protein BD289DRAFT_134319 [Coniella lustricola]|uniref:Uncharacterized protein n=1 Tax=Coniella lustricola TaxID=2025994 RepID=A0A2T2ZVR9_9PEZI|nr:hypothetical protein BD289DRAFT_134319 [Coniella lustricola]